MNAQSPIKENASPDRGVRALIISDIHANLQALEAVLAHAPEHDLVWNLGDVVGYGANPNEVIDKVRQLGGVAVRGNHDRACCGKLQIHEFSQAASHAITWTRGVLTEANREWLKKLPAGPVQPGARGEICVHGSPADEDEYLIFPEDAGAALSRTSARVTFFGHTHWQVGFSRRGKDLLRLKPEFDSRHDAAKYELQLRKGTRYVLNPGSVGQPRDGDWRASFAVYDSARALFTWYRVPYELDIAQLRILRAGLPEFLATRLLRGQ